ncbi:DUF418 domain-containing protein [Sphingomicrobium sp. XHP0239]|uniref:DUF418 domain-containing protein n=1 Tax=Sphingomicrobium maritimum TaxID=3133972 RepID=UPI0031CC5EB9
MTTPDRIDSLDHIRGIAVMGIFSANVIAMGLMQSALSSPTLLGLEHWGDRLVWILNLIFVDGKMRGLFSILFGAGLVLISEKAIAKGRMPAALHFPRLAVLALFGLAHYLFLWWGDILLHYAIIGTIAFFFYDKAPRFLFAWATIFLIANALLMGSVAWYMMDAAASNPAMAGLMTAAPASADEIAAANAFHQNIGTHLAHQLERAWPHHSSLTLFLLPETLGLMLLGMATYKSGFLGGELSDRTYRRWALFGIGGAVVVGGFAAWLAAVHDFAPLFAQIAEGGLIAWIKPVQMLGYAALVILLFRRGGPFAARVAAVGRMAFSNYLAPTIIMTPILFGFGAGLFNQLSRGTLWIAFVPAMWALMLIWSKPWLERYRYGPLEWLWRSLARRRLEPMRR